MESTCSINHISHSLFLKSYKLQISLVDLELWSRDDDCICDQQTIPSIFSASRKLIRSLDLTYRELNRIA